MADISKIKPLGSNTAYDIKDNSAIASITRSGTTFTATRRDGTTFTFTQQDNNTTYTLSGALNNNTFVNTLTPSSGNVTTATVPAMTAASSSVAGKAGLVPAPEAGKNMSFLRGDGTWSNPQEAYLEWGGRNFSNSYGCIDAAMVSDLGANRFMFLEPAGIIIEYSRDGGSTWIDYNATDQEKRGLFSVGGNFLIGKADTSDKATANGTDYQLRVTLSFPAAGTYTVLNKFVLFVSTNGSSNCTTTIQIAKQDTANNTNFTYTDIATNIPISGWSGYNVINVPDFTTYSGSAKQADLQYGRIRFIFKANGGKTDYEGLQIRQIMGFGGVGWQTPSTMAKTGHLYAYDNSMNATFPAEVTATQFNGNATTASKLSNTSKIGDTNKPVYFKADGTPEAINYTIDKSVPSDAVFTDKYVKQTEKSDNVNYKILMTTSDSPTSGNANEAAYDTGITINPSSHTLQTGRYFHNVVSFESLRTPKEILIKTKIPFVNSVGMPKIIFHMNNYPNGTPTELALVFYIYNRAFCNYGVTSNSTHRPVVTLSTYEENGTDYVAIGLGLIGTANYPNAFFTRFNVDVLDIWTGQERNYCNGWTVIENTDTTTIIPTANQVTLSYKDSANQVENNLILKIKSGTTEGTDCYTFNGSAAKTLNILQGTGITLTAAASSLTIANAGVTGVKGNSETNYRTGNVNITPANILGSSSTAQFYRGDNTWSNTLTGDFNVNGVVTATKFIGALQGNADTATNLSGTKTANYVYAGPASGNAAAPTFRALVAADIPALDYIKINDILTTSSSHFNLNTSYNAGLYSITGGYIDNYPILNSDGTAVNASVQFGTLLTLPYRKAYGNSEPDYGLQLFNRAGFNRLLFRTGISNNSSSWSSWRELVHIAANTKTGNIDTPIYINNIGEVVAITGALANDITGNATTATTAGGITAPGTTAQFWRGDNSWSNILAQTAATTLGINTSNSKIGTAVRTLHIATKYSGTGAEITEGDSAGLTFGISTAAYAGIYYQSSGSYGSRLYFATTNNFASGSYARMMITHDGKIGIGTTSPSTRLHVAGDVTVTGLTASQAVFTDENKKLVSRAIKNNITISPLGWASISNDIMLVTSNTIAFWNGAFQGTSSNLKYSANGEIVGLSTAQTISATKTFNAIQKFTNITDSGHSQDETASVSISGGLSVAKNISTKAIRIDNNNSSKGVSLEYNSILETLNFVFS